MSWLYSQALVEEFLGGSSLDGEPSVQSSGNPTQLAYLPPDKMTAFSRRSLSGMTFKPLTADRGEALLMSYLAAFHAKTSQQQEEGLDSTASDPGCGEKWRGWLAKYDPDSSLWRTAQCSLLGEEQESLATLPRWGMTVGGLLWELEMSALLTKETECGSSEKWATPQHRDYRSGQASRWDNPKRSRNLNDQVAKWPTPTRRDYKGANGWGRTQEKLACGLQAHIGQLPNAVQQELGRPIGGTLNPVWVEWLMGWPLGWTDLKPLVMDKSHSVPQQPGDC